MIQHVVITTLRSTSKREGNVSAGLLTALRELEREFVGVTFQVTPLLVSHPPVIRVSDWREPQWHPARFDQAIFRPDARPPRRLQIIGPPTRDTLATTAEILTRYQSCLACETAPSDVKTIERILASHRELHDLTKPLVFADYLHALDTRRWLLRLEKNASLALQTAALFHDVERLVSEADVRVEHHASDYQAFKDRHAATGAGLASKALVALNLDSAFIDRVTTLIATHEKPGRDRELQLLNDADALSFFGLNSAGFLDYYGPAHTARKVAYTLRRLRRPLWKRLGSIRLRPDVERIVHAEARRLATRETGKAVELR